MMWEYSIASGWQQIPDAVSSAPDDESYEDTLLRLGYSSSPSIRIGSEFCGVDVRVYPRAHGSTRSISEGYEFFIEVGIAGNTEFVLTKTLPDVVELLGKLAPIGAAASAGLNQYEADQNIE